MRRLFARFCVAAFVIVVCGIIYLRTRHPYLYNQQVVQRALTYSVPDEIANVSWYEPKTKILGTENFSFERAEPTEALKSAIDESVRYLEQFENHAFIVVHNNKLIYEKYWGNFTDTSHSNSMSMAKSLWAIVYGIAVEKGVAPSLDSLVIDHLRELKTTLRKDATIRDLLNMRSGLTKDVNWTFFPWLTGSEALYLTDNLNDVLREWPSDPALASKYQYSNADTQALVTILNQSLKGHAREFLQDQLWKPAGARDGALWLDKENGMFHGFCCVFADPLSWAKVGAVVAREGKSEQGERIVSKAWLDFMRTSLPEAPYYGAQLWIGVHGEDFRSKRRSEAFAIDDLVYFDGRAEQRVYISSKLNLVIVRIGKEAPKIDDAKVPNPIIRVLLNQANSSSSAR